MSARAPAPGLGTSATAERFHQEDSPSNSLLAARAQPFEAIYTAGVVQRLRRGFPVAAVAAQLGLQIDFVRRIAADLGGDR